MAIRLASHLHRSRSGTLHFRLAIPPDLWPRFTVKEIYRSLHTANVRSATTASQGLSAALWEVFVNFRQESMSDNKKTPLTPPINTKQLLELMRTEKQKHRYLNRIDELEDELARSQINGRREKALHARDLSLVLGPKNTALRSSLASPNQLMASAYI